ncbi:MAG: bifunctional phosphoribosylaminoimidazolecarboxamide formyltransferase/IMP cyclohydrolase [Candidatus Altiarchaeota archaeon]
MKASCALISVSDKTGVVDFGRGLHKLGVKILSSGGTAKALSDAGIPVTAVSDYTGFPEMLGGRVKTLHPKVHAGILAVRSDREHMGKLKEHGIEGIDVVAVNLYPFQETVARKGVKLDEAIENIDVGGPALLRAAAKNHRDVAVIVDPADYAMVLGELRSDKSVSDKTLKSLAVKAFTHTAEYDSAITRYLSGQYGGEKFPKHFTILLEKAYDMRYGENPHQEAAFYVDGSDECSIASAKVVFEGKQLSFNNILDLNSALDLVKEFDKPAAVIVKHLSPSGVGVADNIFDAYELAHKADPMSAYGCVIAFNREPDEKTAEEVISTFVEAVVAPSYTGKVVKILSKKEKMRVLSVGEVRNTTEKSLDYRRVIGGMLVQTPDLREVTRADLKVVSKRKPTEAEVKAMLFAWKVCRHTKSNSIILAKEDHTVGIGAGQMSRVDSVKIAAMKAGKLAEGTSMASDAFFPFRDGIDEAAKAGVAAVIHPGGSIRDEEVIKAADEHNMAMAFTGIRCFLH